LHTTQSNIVAESIYWVASKPLQKERSWSAKPKKTTFGGKKRALLNAITISKFDAFSERW